MQANLPQACTQNVKPKCLLRGLRPYRAQILPHYRMVTADTYLYSVCQTFYPCEKSILGENPVLVTEKFPAVVLPSNARTLHLR